MIESQRLRELMRSWASGVTIVTAGSGRARHGMTVSSFTSVSLSPPIVLVSIERSTRTHELILSENRFAVSILEEAQEELANRFARQIPDAEDRFTEGVFAKTISGIYYPRDCLAVIECEVNQSISAGTHTVFLANVIYGKVHKPSSPLLYFNQSYQKLSARG